MERLTIGTLAVLGLLISGYVAAVYHQWTPDVHRFIPAFCRMEPGTCATVLEARQARLLGIPNCDLGILFYVSVVISSLLPDVWRQLRTMLFLGSIVAVAMGIYLSYVLVVQLKVRCGLCFTSHAINLILFLFILVTP